jgi:hypothetical protein
LGLPPRFTRPAALASRRVWMGGPETPIQSSRTVQPRPPLLDLRSSNDSPPTHSPTPWRPTPPTASAPTSLQPRRRCGSAIGAPDYRGGRAREHAGVRGGAGGRAAALPARALPPVRRPLPPVLPPEYGAPTPHRFLPLFFSTLLCVAAALAKPRGARSVHGAVARQVCVVLPTRIRDG